MYPPWPQPVETGDLWIDLYHTFLRTDILASRLVIIGQAAPE